MLIELEPLPYDEDALEPVISRRAVRVHRVLQERYLRAVDAMLPSRYRLAAQQHGLRGVIDAAAFDGDWEVMFNASQALNHVRWWRSLRPWSTVHEPHRMPATVRQALLERWGTVPAAISAGAELAGRVFASGWLWLVLHGGRLQWVATVDAGEPALANARILLCIDLWEHAWILDHPPQRPYGASPRAQWARTVLERIANWPAVGAGLTQPDDA
jgi:Fe-Mn family superoxide dismutase